MPKPDSFTGEPRPVRLASDQDWAPPPHNNCTRCNGSMPSWRINTLCEECFAEESDEFDNEIEFDEDVPPEPEEPYPC